MCPSRILQACLLHFVYFLEWWFYFCYKNGEAT